MALVVPFEGLPGCGKSTAIEAIKRDPRLRGLKVAVLDIDSSPDAPFIRLITNACAFDSPIRMLLFWALHLQLYDIIQRRKNDTDIILVDRFLGSLRAYDVYGNGVPRELADWVSQYIKRWPDITFFLDVPLEVAQKRKQSKTFADPDFAKRVCRGYQKLAREFSWVLIDADRDPTFVAGQCVELIIARLNGPDIR